MKQEFNKKGAIGKSTIILGVIALVVIATFGIFSVFAQSSGTGSTGITAKSASSSTTINNEGVQTATLSYKNYEYQLEPNNLKKGVPVKITVDTSTVVGCMRDVVISDFGVRKYVTPQDNIIEFTPDKDGTFWIVCSMNMGRGTFSVSSDGSTPTAQAKAASTPPLPAGGAGSCGASGGGCGCGH